MKYKFLLALILIGSCGILSAQKKKYNKEEIQHRFTYLTMNGEFQMDTKDLQTINDIRNPSRIILSTPTEKGTTTTMSFFNHFDSNKLEAKCEYQYISSRPDPYYFPNTSKTSIWDIFEKVESLVGNCEKYEFVISRSPHDTPLHMHLRYGYDVDKLLNMSHDAKDDKYNPWWAEYIEAKKK